MLFFSAFLFAVSASLDALIVGLTWGLHKIRISLRQNLVISLITLLGTVLAMILGNCFSPMLTGRLGDLAGSCILIGIGCFYLIKSLVTEYNTPRLTELRRPAPLQSYESLLCMGVALSVNNMGIGISAGMAGLTLLPTMICTFLCSLIFLSFGCRLGQSKHLKPAEKIADPLSGILLIGLGICQLI